MKQSALVRHLRSSVAVASLLAMIGALPGCQIWNAWLDALKWRDLDTGKPAGQKNAALAKGQAGPALPGGGAAAVGAVGMVPRVTVYRITVPVGSFSGNDKIWSQLNEDSIDSKTSVLMAQNGLRAATGEISRWPAIARLLDAPGASNDQVVLQTDGRSSINVVTHPNVTDQIVVSVDHDLQQQGRTFERCDNGFRLSMRGVRNKPELQVQLEPVVTLGTVEVMRTGAAGGEMGITRTGFTSEEGFEDLRMAATLNASQFLVIAAMDPRSSPFSVGTLWLSSADKVPATETVLVFVPMANGPVAGK